MKNARQTSIVVAAALFFGTGGEVAIADSQTEYSFLLPGFDYETDVVNEYEAANAEFAGLQTYAGFKPGDLVDFTYDNGAQIQVILPLQGSICIQGKCTWGTSIHFGNTNMPVQLLRPPGSSKKTIMPVPPGATDGPTVAVQGSGFFDYSGYTGTPIPVQFPGTPQPIAWLWGHSVVTVGPITVTQIGNTPIAPGTTVSATDPVTGQTMTATVSQDGTTVSITTTSNSGAPVDHPRVDPEAITVFRDGPAVVLSASPTSLSFGTRANSVTTKSVTITNQDSLAKPLAITVANTSGLGWFDVASSTCGASLAVGASCTVNVRYNAGCGLAGSNAGTLGVSQAVVPLLGSYSSGMCY